MKIFEIISKYGPTVWFFGMLFNLALISAVIWAAYPFIVKYW